MITAQYKGKKLVFQKTSLFLNTLIGFTKLSKSKLPKNVNTFLQVGREFNCSSKDIEFYTYSMFVHDYIAIKVKGVIKYYTKIS